MTTVTLNNNSSMPLLGLGTWKSSRKRVYQAVRCAIAAGYRHIDCAAIYGNEKEVGSALHDAIQAGDVTREDMWITSKLWNDAHATEAVPAALQTTLNDLQLEYLDLYLMHWPVAMKVLPSYKVPLRGEDFIALDDLPLIDTWCAMEQQVQRQLVRTIGVSNFSINKLQALLSGASILPAVNQVECHPYLQQNALQVFCQQHHIHLTAYAPLGSSDRPKILKQPNEPPVLAHPVIEAIAELRGITPAQVLLAWSMQRGWSVIPKSITPAHIEQNKQALSVALTDNDLTKITACDWGYRFITGCHFTVPGSPYTPENLWDEG